MWGIRNEQTDLEKSFLQERILQEQFSTKLSSRKNILLIEDDLDFAQLMAELLEDFMDLKVDVAADPYEAMTRISEKVYDCIVLDWVLEDMTGKKTMEKVESLFRIDPTFALQWKMKSVPVIVLSGHGAEEIQPFGGEHFKYRSYISKRQSLKEILEQLREEVGSPYVEEVC